MNFTSIDIQGSILSFDILAKIRSEQASFQQGKDFHPDFTNAKLKDEISLAWQEAKGQWTIFKSKLARLKEGETGTTETRNFWITPLLTNLGYNLVYNRHAEELNGKLFPIGYRDSNLDGFPVFVCGCHESLDKRPENKQLRVSPHAMVQEYLNYSEHLYGMVTNGCQLRLLRDATRITRLSYVEFNLEKMMEEDLYSDFVILYRVMHASRMPKKIDQGAESIIEKYHQEGLAAGSTIRSKLGDAVKDTILCLANGFISHPNNASLRETMASGNFNADEYYRHQLRIIYRLLFLFVIEERNLVYADNKTAEAKRFNHIYFNYYSLLRLRKLAKKLLPPEANRHYDLWQSLVSTFSLFEKKEIGEKLGIMALQGDLFGYHAISGNGYDLHQCYLSNSVLLNVIKSLSYFKNDNGVLIAVNYGGLDVEEFGSVYEGLLELKLEVKKIEGSDQYSCSFDTSKERGKSGSHYTPEELVQPLIKHSLDYLIEDRVKPYQQKKASKEATVQSLLNLKIADIACGSGHILLSAARRLSLEIARVQTEEEQPNPVAIRKAMKDVVRNCIYGVDKNPLAVELCKIALWLEAYNPGEPLNFLDHHIKCGDAIVGLAHRSELENGIADEAFKTLPGDNKEIAQGFAKRNRDERKRVVAKNAGQQLTTEQQLENTVQEAMAEYGEFTRLPETTPEEIERKARAYQKFIDGKGFTFLKAMADTQVAQFFIPKTEANKDYLMTDADYRLILSGYKGWQDRKVAKATVVALEQRFFHWFIEFPEVFQTGGFDCVLGNPPFLGGSKISTYYGEAFLNFLLIYFQPIGSADLIVFFLRRITKLISSNSHIGLISTKSLYEGKSREGGFEIILRQGFKLNFVNPSILWPGVAKLYVCLFALNNKTQHQPTFINNKRVDSINQFFEEGETKKQPYDLSANLKRVFEGSKLHGNGFFLDPDEARKIIEADSINSDVIFELINGDNLNDNPDQRPTRFVIDFRDWDINKARIYKMPFERIEIMVKPERDHSKRINNKERWWIHAENRPGLYGAIKHLKKCIITASTSKYLNFSISNANYVFTNAIYVYASESMKDLSIIQSFIFEAWARSYSSSLGNTLRFTPSSCFVNFPFPPDLSLINEQELESIGESYHEHRKQLMLGIQLGLTKTYNLFHSNAISAQAVNSTDKLVVALQKHLEKTPNTITFNEAIQGILKLRELHVQMDEAVLDAYGWNDIALRHNFYEVEYLPKEDNIRFTIHPDARKEVLKRLLELNHKIHEEEVAAGLWDKKPTTKPKKSKEKNPAQDELF